MASQASSKRGLGWAWNNPASHFPLYQPAIAAQKLTWLFNWEMWAPPNLPSGVEYIPQVRLGTQAKEIDAYLMTLQRERGSIAALLGFNEPDIVDQANMSVEHALQLWREFVLPAKEKFGLRLGAPAVSSDPKGKRWLEDFFGRMNGEDGVDFLVLHWYGTDTKQMMGYLNDMHEVFGKPVWLNEFAYSHMGSVPAPTTGDVEAFLGESMLLLDGCGFIERYAYFGAPPDISEWVGTASSFAEESSTGVTKGKMRLSSVGKVYTRL